MRSQIITNTSRMESSYFKLTFQVDKSTINCVSRVSLYYFMIDMKNRDYARSERLIG